MKNIIIIGGGIIGLTTAYKLSLLYNNIKITVLEKESNVGKHQSSHNSGVLHCGLYYKPGSLKAKLAVKGIAEMTEFCKLHSIPHEICGKLVIATNKNEKERLNDLYARGIQNGLQGLKLLSSEEIKAIEPHSRGVLGLLVPQEGIVDYSKVILTLKELILKKNHSIICNSKVTTIMENQVITKDNIYESDYIINCTGLYSDRIAKLDTNIKSKIIPFRGEYYKLKKNSRYLVKNLIYPVPDPNFPFLGVHFTRRINGDIEAGPNAIIALSREGYTWNDINFKDVIDYILYPGFWKFIFKHKRMCFKELIQSISKNKFCKELKKLVPNIKEEDLEFAGSGVRAQAMSRSGDLIHDFEIVINNNVCHVINAPSPAATASLSIADEIITRLKL